MRWDGWGLTRLGDPVVHLHPLELPLPLGQGWGEGFTHPDLFIRRLSSGKHNEHGKNTLH